MVQKILIAGAEIGRLTAASCLMKAGFDVEIYEQAPALSEIGAGIQISANAMHVLSDLGLRDALSRASPCGLAPTCSTCIDSGEEISRFSLADEHERLHGAP